MAGTYPSPKFAGISFLDGTSQTSAMTFDAGAALLDPLSLAPVLPSFDYRLTTPDCVPPGQFSRPSTGYRTMSSGLLQAVTAGTPRIDHDPMAGTNLGLLVEEGRTNLFTYSGDVGAAGTSWALGSNASFQGLVTAPDGTATARVLRMTSTGSAYVAQSVPLISGGTYTFSGWARLVAGTPSGSSGGLLLVQGSVPSAQLSIAGLTSAWQRFSITVTASSNGASSFYPAHDMAGSGNVDIALWGLQLEGGPFASSYIATTGASAARAADSLVVPLTSDWFNSAEGTLFLEVMAGPSLAGRYPGYFGIDDGTGSNGLQVVGSGGGNPYVQIANAAASNQYVTAGFASSPPQGTPLRFALAYNAAGAVASMNGGAPVTLSQPFPGGLNTLRIGQTFGGGNYPNTQIRRLAYAPRATSAALLQRMSA